MMGTKLGMGSLVLKESILVDSVCVPLFQERKWWLRAALKKKKFTSAGLDKDRETASDAADKGLNLNMA